MFCSVHLGQNALNTNDSHLFCIKYDLKQNITVGYYPSYDVHWNDWLMATYLSSVGHLDAVQRTSAWSRHFTHKAGLKQTERQQMT